MKAAKLGSERQWWVDRPRTRGARTHAIARRVASKQQGSLGEIARKTTERKRGHVSRR